jgi:UDP-2,4-diacetamido-2,4,6-trideoxy-beta-L-altropyranose hydrolase
MVLIFTEALESTGLGHFTRCSALAEILKEADCDVEMILHTDNTALVNAQAFPVRNLDWKNALSLAEVFAGRKVTGCFVDSYLARLEIYQEIQSNSTRLICIDDANRILYPAGSYILHPGFGGPLIGYDTRRYTVFAGGEYALVRKPFRESFKIPPIRRKIESILITVGAHDHLNIVPLIVAMLKEQYHDWRKNIIVTSAFQNLAAIETMSDNTVVLHRDLSAMQMREVMLAADVAITAGGQTIYELARCGVPMILIETAENQRGNIVGFEQEYATVTIGKVQDPIFLEKLNQALASLASKGARLICRDQLFCRKKDISIKECISGILT